MDNAGGYYLHDNGSLIHKTYINREDMLDSDLVRGYWYDDEIGATPGTFLAFLKEARDLGAAQSDLLRLVDHNHLEQYIPDCCLQLGIER